MNAFLFAIEAMESGISERLRRRRSRWSRNRGRRSSHQTHLIPRCEPLEDRRLLDAALGGVLLAPAGSPEMTWSSYLGGQGTGTPGGDAGDAVAVDSTGAVLIAGTTDEVGWVSGGYDLYNDEFRDGFVVKLSDTGDHVWSTFLGGNKWWEDANGVAVDQQDNVVIVGLTRSNGWISGGYDTKRGGYDGFVVKLSPSGQHLWSTYVGGASDDEAYAVAVDSVGNIILTGLTRSDRWVSGGADTSRNGGQDAFVVKISPSGELLWSTYLGGTNDDYGRGIAIDGNDDILVTGSTASDGWTTDGNNLAGSNDAFIAKLSGNNGTLQWSRYMGGSDAELAYSVSIDPAGNFVVAGWTRSPDLPNAVSPWHGEDDAFVAKFAPDGSPLWSTYLGGPSVDFGAAAAIDANGSIFVTGKTSSFDWVSGGFDTVTTSTGAFEAFMAKLDSQGTLLWSSYVGDAYSAGTAIALNDVDSAFVVGTTEAAGWTAGGYDTTFGAPRDAFVAKIRIADPTPGVTVTPTAGLQTSEDGTTASFTVVLNTQPTADVTIGLSSDDSTEGTVTPTSVTFTPANWDQPQAAIVTGIDDTEVDGDIVFTIVTSPALSTDANYNGVDVADVSVTNLDNEVPPVATAIYVWDIVFETRKRGPHSDARIVIDVRIDSNINGLAEASDAAAAGAQVTVEFTDLSGTVTTYTGTTDSSGVFHSGWIKDIEIGSRAEVVDLVLTNFQWDPFGTLDPTANDNDADGDGLPDELYGI